MNEQTSLKPPARFRRWFALAALCVLSLSGLAWLAGSAAGFKLLCGGLTRLTANRLQIEAPGGRLLGNWHAESVRWLDASQEIEARQLTVNWSPRELLRRELAIERIDIASLRVVTPPGGEAAAIPDSLELPVALSIANLSIGTLQTGAKPGNATVIADDVAAVLRSDGQVHHLARLQARVGLLNLVADASLSAKRPFEIKARAVLKGRALDQSLALDLRGVGPLARIEVDGRIAAGDDNTAAGVARASGDLHAVLTPFAAQSVASLGAHFAGIDPAAFAAGAPNAQLDIDATLESRPAAPGESSATGRLTINNRRAGTLDQQLLPVESLNATLDWQQQNLSFPDLTLALAGGGRLAGKGRLDGRSIALDLTARAIDARALHPALLPTRLSGPLHLELGGDRRRIELDLRDSQLSVSAHASLAAEVVEISQLQLGTSDARLSAQGRLALSEDKRFSAQGTLHNFDPARFFKAGSPLRGVINAEFDARGALNPAPELALHFDLRDSRLGAERLAGKGDVDLRGERLRKVELDLDAAGNHLTATGAFGSAGDALRLKLLAPKLAAIGWAGLAGDATADLIVGGSLAKLEFSGQLKSEKLMVAKWLDLQGLSLTGQLAAGAQGKLRGELRCAACALPEYGIPPLALTLNADGALNEHRLNGQIGLPDKRDLRFAFAGGIHEQKARRSGGDSTVSWNGMLGDLSVASSPARGAKVLLRLGTPAPLKLSSSAIAFGPAIFDGLLGTVRIDRLGHEQGRWQSAGRWQQFRLQTVLDEFPSLRDALNVLGKDSPQTLVLGGEWDFSLDNKPAALPAGRVAVWRDSGDLVLGTVALGLDQARVQATLGDGRVMASAQLRGAQLGEVSAELTAPSARRADGRIVALIDAQAPWQGRLQASVPDLAWLGPFVGEAWQVAGKLEGEMRLGGSPSHPQFAGEWRGRDLAVRALDLGLRLERGQALVAVQPERLRLQQLSFESEFQPLPSVLKLDQNVDVTKLVGAPGRVEASGELMLAPGVGGNAHLNVRLDRLGVVQRSDQWIALSGESELRLGEKVLDVGGNLRVDAGLWSLAEAGRPRLSDDVVIRKPQAPGGTSPVARKLRLDLEATLGRSVHFRGAGVESRLAGQIRLRSDDAGLPRASGSIRTIGGRFDAYGQTLGIQRGIINFQGAIDNPGLNILAVHENLPVEAGVEVTGTAQRPRLRLVSTPDVADTEKLSWLVLGRSPEQQGAGDNGILLAAAQTILGGQDGGVLRQLQRGLGIDEFGVSTGEIGGYGKQPTSRVASSSGFGGSQTVNGQIVTVGKRLSSNALLSYEQSLNTAESIVKLTVNLSRQFSVVGRAGSESALDFFWHYRFGK